MRRARALVSGRDRAARSLSLSKRSAVAAGAIANPVSSPTPRPRPLAKRRLRPGGHPKIFFFYINGSFLSALLVCIIVCITINVFYPTIT
ncbi:MAG: hypothetical protein RMJ53_06935 [Chitinophagales bacterium]|nr:hypothetical protein [Chitinophagales bacterium]MDW8273945.1 hypothetical protein [Chitinophagales bacterium]